MIKGSQRIPVGGLSVPRPFNYAAKRSQLPTLALFLFLSALLLKCTMVSLLKRRVHSGGISIHMADIQMSESYPSTEISYSTPEVALNPHDFKAVTAPHQPTATLVTAFYPLGDKAKASPEDYRQWISAFFGQVQAPIVVYVPHGGVAQEIQKLRGNLSVIIKVCNCEGEISLDKQLAT